MIDAVNALGLSKGRTTALIASLDAALEQVNRGNDKTAINALGAFINKVEAQAGKSIDPSDAEALIAAAEDIIDAINNLSVSAIAGAEDIIDEINNRGVSVAEERGSATTFADDSSGGSALGPWSLLLLLGLRLIRGRRTASGLLGWMKRRAAVTTFTLLAVPSSLTIRNRGMS